MGIFYDMHKRGVESRKRLYELAKAYIDAYETEDGSFRSPW